MNDKSIDQIYSDPLLNPGKFTFNQQVVDVFPDMINRSVPGYATIVNMTGVFAERFVNEGDQCYDLGCSLGASSFSIAEQLSVDHCTIVGIDNSSAMIDRCRSQNVRQASLRFELDDISTASLSSCAFVVLNFTLQFIPTDQRQQLIDKIYHALNPGGALLISEKIRFDDPHLDQLNIEMHENFKRLNGYSDLEIAQKRSALDNVLIPETIAAHKSRLRSTGFNNVDVWFQCFNFISMIAIK